MDTTNHSKQAPRTLVRFYIVAAGLFIVLALIVAPQQLVADSDGRRDGMLSQPRDDDALVIVRDYLDKHSADFQLTAADLDTLTLTDRYTSAHNGVTHLYLQQTIDGIPLYGAQLAASVMPDGRILHIDNRTIRNGAARASLRVPLIEPVDAVKAALTYLNLSDSALRPTGNGTFTLGAVVQEKISAELLYLPINGNVHLTWNVAINMADGQHWWHIQIDASDGQYLAKYDYVVNDSWDGAGTVGPNRESLLQPEISRASAIEGDAYLVFPFPAISPDLVMQTIVVDPADPIASPFGWHDTDGDPQAEYNDTRGNNVFAQEDGDANNVSGATASGGLSRDFLHVYDAAAAPNQGTNQNAAITNLFYWNNITHDVLYHYGFDEAAGNFQKLNYSGTGVGDDYVRADAQDGSGTNNANFATAPDGIGARMQMYVWSAPSAMEVISPTILAGTYPISTASFGDPLPPAGVTASVVAGVDDTGVLTDGCTALVNSAEIDGKIALLDRGTCLFTIKVRNAQTAGAIAVIIANNIPGGSSAMSGTDGSVIIPSVMTSQADGDAIRAQLDAGVAVSVTLSGPTLPDRDSDLDAGIIVHEYGHGVSNRLVGGPSNTSCLSNIEQMGEGWSDFLALALTTVPPARSTDPRGIATYVAFQQPDSNGIRLYPYSTDMAINPLTYDDIDDPLTTIPHGVGTIWATMLWELYWNLVDVYGFDADLYYGDGGNNMALQLVLDGMKLQACLPTFENGRDAILAADVATYGGANQCAIWEAFARRGMGVSASGGLGDSLSDGIVAFDVPLECEVAMTAPMPTQTVCAGQSAEFVVRAGNQFTSDVALQVTSAPTGPTIAFSTNPILNTPGRSIVTISDTQTLTDGTHTLTIEGAQTPPLIDEVTLSLNIETAPPAAPALLQPFDLLTGSNNMPLLVWEDSGATSYQVEVATDPLFSTILITTETADTTLRLLLPEAQGITYYWRVQATGVCGAGDFSSPFSFTSGIPLQLSTTSAAQPNGHQISALVIIAGAMLLSTYYLVKESKNEQ